MDTQNSLIQLSCSPLSLLEPRHGFMIISAEAPTFWAYFSITLFHGSSDLTLWLP
jgi:hypothetical protein